MKRLRRPLLSAVAILLLSLCGSSFAEGDAMFVFPLLGERVTSAFGTRKHPVRKVTRHHNGIDLAAAEGAQIRAIASGTVIFADPFRGYGNLVVIEHKNGISSHYGHCKRLFVQPGQSVRAGQIIGSVGSTGLATGPHLHFEIRMNGKPKNPDKYIPGLRDEALG